MKEFFISINCFWNLKETRRQGENNMRSGIEGTIRTFVMHRRYSVTDLQNLSKDDMIETLKAEIQRLQAGNVNASTSNTFMPLQSRVSMPYNGRERRKVSSHL